MTPTAARALLNRALEVALAAAQPAHVLAKHLPAPPEGRLLVVGAGKAAASMAQATERFYAEHDPELRLEGLVMTRYGHGLPTECIRVLEASHPVPDAAGLQGTREIMALASSLTEHDLLLCLISGGASALLCAPKGVTLAQKAALTERLLRSGADIHEINTVRKHLSAVKGGNLAKAAYPARVCALIISDVAGDDLSVIASGPTVPDSSTVQDAEAVLARYKLPPQPFHETPKAAEAAFRLTENHLIASAQGMLEQVAAFFKREGVAPFILSESVTGEAREVAKVHAAVARQVRRYQQPLRPPCVILSGGETTVTVRGSGRGGRNAEFALSLALELSGLGSTYALAADTDGIDGNGDAAGACVTPETLDALGKQEAGRYLDNNDAYSFFARAGGLIHTGPTLTNVNDLRMILLC